MLASLSSLAAIPWTQWFETGLRVPSNSMNSSSPSAAVYVDSAGMGRVQQALQQQESPEQKSFREQIVSGPSLAASSSRKILL